MIKFYTIFLGNELWKNVIDDMNTTEDFSIGGMLWTDKKLARACIKNLKQYDYERKGIKFHIVELKK